MERREVLGLTNREAVKRLEKYGYNEIREVKNISALKIVLRQIKGNFIVYLLFVTVIISFLLGKAVTGYTISIVILIVIIVGFLQEYKAERAIKSLKEMIMPWSIVLRDGKEEGVASREIVLGDVLLLRTGERIPADCVILEEKDLEVDESSLTGESREIRKNVAKDIKNYNKNQMVFAGTYIIRGKCRAQVLHTGMNTEFGKIANMISTAEKELPLQKKFNRIGKQMTLVSIIISVITGLMILITGQSFSQTVLFDTLLVVIALSVSAFPEGFPVVLISTLSSGAHRMAKKNAIVHRMSTIETLGETTVICADKTGTITKGEMTVKKIYVHGKIFDVEGTGYEAEGEVFYKGNKVTLTKEETLALLYKASVLCNDTIILRKGADREYNINGSPTEAALLIMAAKLGVFREDMESIRKEELSFTPDRKMMSILSKEKTGYSVYAKGAPEVLLKKCSYIKKEGGVVSLGECKREEILSISKKFTSKTYRVVALAYKTSDKNLNANSLEEGLIFLGLVAIDDPPREEVKEAINTCVRAGIKVKIITGDNKGTALAIAKEVGIKGEVILGEELDKITDDELSKAIRNIAVFARVRPEHKLRIVKALKANGEVVTMTGDGVNDAPALKEAHIGVAMGKTGTDVSREASDIVLKDDNFATIVTAIKEGRTIFNNIRKFLSYQLSCNYAELMIIFVSVMLGLPLPLLALQILFMNLVTDDLPALTLGFNPSSHDIMTVKPRKKSELFPKEIMILTIIAAAIITIGVVGLFYYEIRILGHDVSVARTTALITLILFEITNAFNFRSFRKPVHKIDLFANKYLVYASIISIIATIIIIYTGVNSIFGTVPVGLWAWVVALAISLSFVGVFGIIKSISIKKNKIIV